MDKKPPAATDPATAALDAPTLRTSARSMPLPIRLRLAASENGGELICTDVIRHLPGKRLTCYGVWKHNTAVVAKVYLAAYRGKKHYAREVKGIGHLKAAQIPTPPILFEGTLSDGCTPVVLSQRIYSACSLQERLAAEDPASAETARILKTVVTSIAQMHRNGLLQRDIHPGNFLVVEDNVMVIDGGDIRTQRKTPLGRRPSIDNLALFLAQFYPGLGAVLPKLVAHYCRCRHWRQTAKLTTRIDKAITRWSNWREKKFVQKTERPCTAFHAQKTWHTHIVSDRAWYSSDNQPLLDDLDTAITDGTVLKAGNSATVAKINYRGQILVVKRYNLKNSWHALRRSMRPTRAMVSWRNANRLHFMGIQTPRPLAIIEKRWGPLRGRAYLIMAYLEGKSIDSAIAEKISDPKMLETYADLLLQFLEQLCQLRLSHSDLKASNLILFEDQLYVLDLDGMQKHVCALKHKRAFRRDIKRLLENWQHDAIFHPFIKARIRKVFPDG